MANKKARRHRHNLPEVICPYCGTAETRCYASNENTLPVRYHRCRNGHNFKSVEVRVVGVAIEASSGQRVVHVKTGAAMHGTPSTGSPASKLAGVSPVD